jgi:Fe-S oxidoreductase
MSIEAANAPYVVTCDAGCMTNINGGLQRLKKPQRALHLAEILACT